MYRVHKGGKPVTVENTAFEAFHSIILLFPKIQSLGKMRVFWLYEGRKQQESWRFGL